MSGISGFAGTWGSDMVRASAKSPESTFSTAPPRRSGLRRFLTPPPWTQRTTKRETALACSLRKPQNHSASHNSLMLAVPSTLEPGKHVAPVSGHPDVASDSEAKGSGSVSAQPDLEEAKADGTSLACSAHPSPKRAASRALLQHQHTMPASKLTCSGCRPRVLGVPAASIEYSSHRDATTVHHP